MDFSLSKNVCPHCNFILDITKTNQNDMKHDLDELQDKILDDFPVTVQINTIKINSIKASNKYKNLTKTEQTKIMKFFEKQINAFEICNNCNYIAPLESGKVIFTNFINKRSIEKYDIMDNILKVNDQTLARTKDYICPNKDCKYVKGVTEAVIYKKPNSHNILYICSSCYVSF